MLWVHSRALFSTEAQTQSTFFGTFLGTLFPKHLLRPLFRVWLKGGLAKGGAGAGFSLQFPKPTCLPTGHFIATTWGPQCVWLAWKDSQAKVDCSIQLIAGVQTAKGIKCEQEAPPTPHEARMAILAIWVWRVRRKRRKQRFSHLFLAAVSGTSHDRTAKTAKKAILAISVWRACMPQWTANLTILARNSRKDSKARSAANQPLH